MKLRKEIEPDFETAKKLYQEILNLILAYTDYCDQYGDDEYKEYKKVENTLHSLTGKDISKFNLWEWWEGEGAENLAFNISLPSPQKVENITYAELNEIVRRLKTYKNDDENDDVFKLLCHYNTNFSNGYFENFLKLNFATYSIKFLQRNKDKYGKYFEYSQEEIVEKTWNNGNYK